MKFLPWLVVAGVLVAPASAARAAPCGVFDADDEDNVIIVGEWVREFDRHVLPFEGSREIGVCWRDGGGTWRFDAQECFDGGVDGAAASTAARPAIPSGTK